MNKMKPFLGRMKVEVIKEDTDKYFKKKDAIATGVSEEFLNTLEIVRGDVYHDPNTGKKEFRKIDRHVPINRGIIVEKSPDCFGKGFQEQFGELEEYPDVGDLVMFIPNSSYTLDLENRYHLVDDNKVIGYIKAEELSNE